VGNVRHADGHGIAPAKGPAPIVLGGQNHRVPAAVRLDARSLWNVDAWMPAQDFDALLRMVYR
jgi:hypothetical protein